MPLIPITLVAPRTVLLTWEERTLVWRRPAGNVVAVDGWVYGALAVHGTWDGNRKPVTITHRPSTLVVARCDSPEQAVKDAEWLWQRCPNKWVMDCPTLAELPADVVQWLGRNKR